MFRFFDALSKAFWQIFDFLSAVRLAKKLKENSDGDVLTNRFGIHAIVCGLSMLVASVFVGVFLLVKIFSIPTLNWVLGATLAFGAVLLLAHTIKNISLQFYLNKSRTSWLFLAGVIGCIAGSVATMLIFAFAI